jgi:hypothetical protein
MKKILIFCLILSGISCTKLPDVPCDAPTRELDLSKQLIVGKWSLVRSQYSGDSGTNPKPVIQSETGIYELVVFTKGGDVLFFTNGFPKAAFHYRILPIKDYFTYEKSDMPILIFEDDNAKLKEYIRYTSVCSDSLYISRGSFSCTGTYETWVRE